MENLDNNNKNVSLSLIAEYGGSDSDSDDTETRSNDNTGNDDSDAPLSEMVLKNNIINACAHGPLSRPNARDEVDVTRHMIIDSSESGVVEYEVTEYRDVDSDDSSSSSDSSDSEVDSVKDVEDISSGVSANMSKSSKLRKILIPPSSSSDSSDSEVDSVKDVEEISSGDECEGSNRVSKPEPLKVNGELGLEDLPPIEDLAISLPAQETTKIGTIASIVDRLVIVRAFPETPAVDLDSVLFLDNGAKTLGKVFDVFGPVTEPHYCVRFNSSEHAAARGAACGADVYIAPRTNHTNYVFLTELMKTKGSDASWLNDVEPPPHQVEYSDDEEERRANKARKEQKKQDDGEPSRIVRKLPERRNQRPSESSSRFGIGPSRGRNPFAPGSRRNYPISLPQQSKPWPYMDSRTPPPHPNGDPGGYGPFSAPVNFTPPMYPPPPLNSYNLPMNVGMRMRHPIPGAPQPFRRNFPVFGSTVGPTRPSPQWVNNVPPPPPGT